jgi:hypothetical protein
LESLCIVNVAKTALPSTKLKSILKIEEFEFKQADFDGRDKDKDVCICEREGSD